MAEVAAESSAELQDGIAAANDFIAQASRIAGTSSAVRSWIGDEITRIDLEWRGAARTLSDAASALGVLQDKWQDGVAAGFLRDLGLGRQALARVILAAAQLTIPARLNEFLDQTRVGQALSFRSLFEDELGDEAERDEVLRRLAEAPADVHGVIDLASKSVIRVSPRADRRRLSYELEAAALVLGGLISFVAVAALQTRLFLDAQGLHADGAALSSLGALLILYAGGAGTHFVFDLIKAQQGSVGSPTWMALDDWLLWMHAREVKVITSVLSLWVAFVGLVLLYPGQPDALTGFLAGYAFDSITDTVIKRFDTLAGGRSRQVVAAIG